VVRFEIAADEVEPRKNTDGRLVARSWTSRTSERVQDPRECHRCDQPILW